MRIFLIATCLFSMFLTDAAQAELDIVITGGIKRRPIAVVPFGWEGNSQDTPSDVAEIISNNLTRSGRFAPIAEDDMLQKPTSGAGLDFDDWSILGVEAVVVGSVTQTGENAYDVQFQLFDVFGRDQLVGYRMPASRGTLRRVAHRASDMIYEKLTGIKGVFDTKVAYVTAEQRGEGQLYSLYVADQDGENEFKIMEDDEPIMSPAWSPDSRRIAYVSFDGNHSSIRVQTLRTGNYIKVSEKPGINGAPAFSPDGRQLVLTLGGVDGNLDIYVVDINSREIIRQLTTHRAIDTEGSWSPDGRYIYFTSDRSGGPQIYRVSASGGTPERVTFEGSYNARPRLSPDGKKLAMVHLDRGNYRIAVMDVERKDLLVLSAGRQDESPSFAPNSDTLIYATRPGRNGVLESVTADGLIRQRLASGQGDVREPVWSPFQRF